ncbi:methyl-accepting chemotaxis protein [Microvirga rosea]|uniref:methyl-accepting chemotaxis protein n=1 Tax=Microvirga rosea TaxID=2715425 RepID=UPI001D0B7B59|nr:methyl-accepting chemotaxis protein [Microvirga rosea]MCB8820481.1 methyl-accepting chemotaxis protein [Microvirga rosea]
MTLKNVSILHKIIAVVSLMGLVAAAIAVVGWRETTDLGRTMTVVGLREEAAREAMDLRVDIIAISRMTYQVAQEPKKAAAFKAEANRRTAEMLGRFQKLEAVADGQERKLLDDMRAALNAYFAVIRAMIDVAGSDKGGDPAVMMAEVEKGLAAQRAVTDSVKAYSTYTAKKMADMRTDAAASAEWAARFQIGVAVVGILLGMLVSLLVTKRGIASPVRRLTQIMRRLAEGDLSVEVTSTGGRDEIGRMTDTVRVFKDSMVRNKAFELEAAQAREQSETQRKQMMQQLASTFDASVGDIVDAVSTAAVEMQMTAEKLTNSARQTAARSTAVASAAEQTSVNVLTMSSATEELGASVNEISRQVEQSAQMSQEAVVEAGATQEIVSALSAAANKIGAIVEMISAIAEQTNLLALNATIEAARAGEAGRGFAVVATEVKGLAEQTGKATAEISSQIAAIQTSTTQAVQAIGSITQRIAAMNEVAASIASSIDQQGAATREIVSSVNQASAGTNEVTTNINGVAQVAEETEVAAAQVLTAASAFSGQAQRLRDQVNLFLTNIRAA